MFVTLALKPDNSWAAKGSSALFLDLYIQCGIMGDLIMYDPADERRRTLN